MAEGLNDRQLEMLAFEKLHWAHAGAKEAQIRERFDVSTTRYLQELAALIDTEAALAAEPLLVGRLRRLRSERQQQRSAKARGIDLS